MSSIVPMPGTIKAAILACFAVSTAARIRMRSSTSEQPVVERRPAEAVAVGDLDHGHTGGVERGDDVAHVLLGELVSLGVRSVAQRRVGHPHVEGVGVRHQRPCRTDVLALHVSGDLVADLCRGRGHDVEVAGVRREEVAGALDLDEDRRPDGCRRGSRTNCGSTVSR